MPHRIAIAAEGPSDCRVLEELCRKAGHVAKAAFPGSGGKPNLRRDFAKILQGLEATFRPTHRLVVVDLQPEMDCPTEAERWRESIRRSHLGVQLCLAIWELEAWLLSDPEAVAREVGVNPPVPNPDRIGDPKPSEVLEDLYARGRGYRRPAYHKEYDGVKLARLLNLDNAARRSDSLDHFLRTLRSRQENLDLR